MRYLVLLGLLLTPAWADTSELVELIKVDPRLKLDIRYATPSNFLGFAVYKQPRAFLQKPAALALKAAHDDLRALGFGLVVFDGYRPWSVTKLMWERTPPEKRAYVANPKNGSRHNRGCAVDLTLFDLETGQPVSMPSAYDDFSVKAHADYPGGTADQRRHRSLLREVLENHGFLHLESEWWHFDFEGWQKYPILDKPFEKL